MLPKVIHEFRAEFKTCEPAGECLHIEHITSYLGFENKTGYMDIYMDKFFPCPKAKFVKLLKIIKYDHYHHYELRERLVIYFQNRISNLPTEVEALQKVAADSRAKAANLKKQMKAEQTEREKNGLAPEPFNRLKTEYINNTFLAKEAQRDAKRLQRSKPTFEEYLNLLQRWC